MHRIKGANYHCHCKPLPATTMHCDIWERIPTGTAKHSLHHYASRHGSEFSLALPSTRCNNHALQHGSNSHRCRHAATTVHLCVATPGNLQKKTAQDRRGANFKMRQFILCDTSANGAVQQIMRTHTPDSLKCLWWRQRMTHRRTPHAFTQTSTSACCRCAFKFKKLTRNDVLQELELAMHTPERAATAIFDHAVVSLGPTCPQTCMTSGPPSPALQLASQLPWH